MLSQTHVIIKASFSVLCLCVATFSWAIPESEVAKLSANDGADGDHFGLPVALSNDIALIGSPRDDDDGDNSGSAYVFVRDGNGSWAQEAKLKANDADTPDNFGRAVALSGGVAVVGALNEDEKGALAGAAYAFVRDGNGSWTQQAKLTATDGAAGDRFGFAQIGVFSNTAVIGAIGDDDKGLDSGSAYVFITDGNSWSQQAKLTASDGASEDFFGLSSAIYGNTIIVGANGDDDNGDRSGSAYVFVRDGVGNWTQQAKLTATDGAAGDRFGDSVAIYGDTVLIGAKRDDDNGIDSGSVYVFVRDGVGNWTQQAKLTPTDSAAGMEFGSVAIFGDTALVGTFGDIDGGPATSSAYIFVRDASGSWTQEVQLQPSDGDNGDIFGESVAISGDTALVGAHLDDDNGIDSGSAYVFALEPAPISVQIDIKPGSDPNSINLCSGGSTPVAIFGSADFDVTQVNETSLTLADSAVRVVGKSDKYLCHNEHINDDVYIDLVCQFYTIDLALNANADTSAELNGNLTDGAQIVGVDSVNLVKECP